MISLSTSLKSNLHLVVCYYLCNDNIDKNYFFTVGDRNSKRNYLKRLIRHKLNFMKT